MTRRIQLRRRCWPARVVVAAAARWSRPLAPALACLLLPLAPSLGLAQAVTTAIPLPGAAVPVAAGIRAPRRCQALDRQQARLEARALVRQLRSALAPVEARILAVPFLSELQAGRLPRDRIAALAAEEYRIGHSDRLSFRQMAERWNANSSTGGAGSRGFFADLAVGEDDALVALLHFAAAMGLDQAALEAYEPRPASQIYPARVASLAVSGDRATAAAALLLNFPVFGEAMARVRQALLQRYGFQPEQIAFVTAFAEPLPPSFEAAALAQISQGLQEGACPADIRRETRLLQQAELSFWQAAATPPGSPLPAVFGHGRIRKDPAGPR